VDKQKEEVAVLQAKISSLQQQLKLTKENHQATAAKKESEMNALKEVCFSLDWGMIDEFSCFVC
jgi:hypothetical protein